MLIAFIVTVMAGLATSIGALIAVNKRVLERPVLAVALAFAAGAMLFVSFIEMLPYSLSQEGVSGWVIFSAFFLGMTLVALIDRLIPSSINPSEIEGKETNLKFTDRREQRRLLRSGVLVATVLALHNFPEGISTFFATYQDLTVGLTLAVAIAIHNIPEGIAVAAPIYAATESRKKAFWWATASGLAEPLGAILGIVLISMLIPSELMGAIFGLVAGMMVFVAIDELLPAARRYQTDKHQVVYGLFGGMAVVALSILLLS